MRLDLRYVENWSLAGPLVLFKTVRAVVRAEGRTEQRGVGLRPHPTRPKWGSRCVSQWSAHGCTRPLRRVRTCVEQVGRRLVKAGHDVVVYCRTHRPDGRGCPTEHRGHAAGAPACPRRRSRPSATPRCPRCTSWRTRSMSRSSSTPRTPLRPDARAPGIPVATHVDGLEWMRGKWQGAGRRYYRLAESMACAGRRADRRRPGHRRLLRRRVRRPDRSHRLRRPDPGRTARPSWSRSSACAPRSYHLVVARFEPENHVDVIVDGYRRRSGDAAADRRRIRAVRRRYTGGVALAIDPRVRLLGACGTRTCSTSSTRTPGLPARTLGGRHEPLAAARHGRRCSDDRLRRQLQPRGPRAQRTVLPYRAGQPTRSSSPRRTSTRRSRGRSPAPARCATTGTR